MPGPAEKLQFLQRISAMQARVLPLTFEADRAKNGGRLAAAAAAYGQLAAVLRELLQCVVEHDAAFPESPMGAAPTANQLANALLTHADVEDALRHFSAAEALRAEGNETAERYLGLVGTAERKRQTAASLLAKSRYHEAILALEEARDAFVAEGNVLMVATVTSNLAEVLEWLGDYRRALADVDRAEKLIEPLLPPGAPSEEDVLRALMAGDWAGAEQAAGLLRTWAGLIQIHGRVSKVLGDYPRAAERFRRVRNAVPAPGRPGIDFQLATIEVLAGRAAEGLRSLEQLAAAFEGLLRPKLGVLLSWQSQAKLALGEPQTAAKLATAACAELARFQDLDSLWKAQLRQAQAFRALDRTGEALQAYQAGADTITKLRRAPLGHRLDSTYLRDKLPLFQEAIRLAAEAGDGKAACRFIEMIKARSLTAMLSVPREEAPKGEMDRRVDELTAQLDALERQTALDPRAGLDREKERVLEERAALIERIRITEPRWRTMSELPRFDPDRALGFLRDRGQAALSLFRDEGEVVAVLLTGGACEVASRHLSERTLKALSGYAAGLQQSARRSRGDRGGGPGLEFDPGALGFDAGDLVPRELLGRAVQAESLMIVPHGLLHLLPWPALPFEGARLFERLPVGMLPNLSCLQFLGAAPARAPRASLFGDVVYPRERGLPMLPEAARELADLAMIYADRVLEEKTGPSATGPALRDLLGRSDAAGAICHIACHGQFVGDEPLRSGLLTAEGRLDGAEIARMRIAYEEVVLSACATGMRSTEVQDVPLAGDDVVGLPGSFLEAGARSIVVSITPAGDSAAADLMGRYHLERAEGAPPLRALRAAQMQLLAERRHAPGTWAGFVVYGCN